MPAVQLAVTCPLPALRLKPLGAPGGSSGVADNSLDTALWPPALLAVILK